MATPSPVSKGETMNIPVVRCLAVCLMIMVFSAIGGLRIDQALAHAVVVASSPKDGAVLEQAPAEIELTFNSRIESALSRFSLTDEEGREIALPDVGQRQEEQKGANRLVIQMPPLQPGHYALHYKVLATDGHSTLGILRFSIVPGAERP
jgi:methionine-rich copper-binding protein CopC